MKHIVGFSGGIDSQACALWVRRHFPPEDVILVNVDPGGNEHPITTEFIETYSRDVFPVHVIKPIVADMIGSARESIDRLGLKPTDELTFPLLAELKGVYPATKSRFCTTHLKLEPTRRWCYEQGGKGLNEPRRRRDGSTWRPYGEADWVEGPLNDGYERYVGVRRDESASRADVADREYDDYFLCWLNRPIASWTKERCFRYVKDAGEAWNPLYDMGFGRVGCAPCINSGKEDVRLWAARFPAMIDKVREWERVVGRTFFPPMVPGKRINWIDEVVEWSRTTHGGRQFGLPILEAEVASGECSNRWGFCE